MAISKKELISLIAEQTGQTKKDTEATINSMLEIMSEKLKGGDDFSFIGFGTFKSVDKPAAEKHNPRNPKEKIKVPAKRVVKFKASKGLEVIL